MFARLTFVGFDLQLLNRAGLVLDPVLSEEPDELTHQNYTNPCQNCLHLFRPYFKKKLNEQSVLDFWPEKSRRVEVVLKTK